MAWRHKKKIAAGLVFLAAMGLMYLFRVGLFAPVSPEYLVEMCMHGTAAEVKSAVASGVDVNARGGHFDRLPLISAIVFGSEKAEKTALLLKAGADPNINDGEALNLAAGKGDLAVIRLLLEAGARVNPQNQRAETPLMAACTKYDKTEEFRRQLIKFFLDIGSDVNLNKSGAYCLVEAAGEGDLETMRLMLDAGVSINAADYRGVSALMMAAKSSPDPDFVARLLENWADPWQRDNENYTALDYARGSTYESRYARGNKTRAAEEIIRLLDAAQSVAPIRFRLAAICEKGTAGELEASLAAGADPNAVDKAGLTPLMLLLTSPDREPEIMAEMVGLLLSAGADPNLRDENGDTALDRARSNETPAAADILTMLEAAQK